MDSGSVYINDASDSLRRYRKTMGFVPQDDILFTSLTVFEMILVATHCVCVIQTLSMPRVSVGQALRPTANFKR